VSHAYYNEIDPYCTAWLRNLIAAGHIAPGEVDERSIVDVRGDDLRGFDQCHFFAGIGVWSYSLRLAKWPDDRRVWTGSCPCQPFSSAGRAAGFGDERHLWPHWERLIDERGPDVIFGEQVASADGLAWLDFVCADLEAAGYAVGAVDTCAAGFGAPHIRNRIYFVAHAENTYGRTGERGEKAGTRQDGERRGRSTIGGTAGGTVDHPADARRNDEGQHGSRSPLLSARLEQPSVIGDVGDAEQQGREGRVSGPCWRRRAAAPSAVNGFWSDAHWLPCIDGKARPVEPGTFPLAHGASARVGRLRAYGNAIVPQVAAEFVRAYMECRP